ADKLKAECPSDYLRGEAAKILERVELIGPLRPPREQFVRVYRSLHWNEPDRVMRIVSAVLPRATGSKPQIEVRLNAWGYVIGVLDEWITQARVFYLVSGILECSLRARLNARMTDVYGPNWPDVPEAVPSVLHELAAKNQRDEQLANVHAAMDEFERVPKSHT